MIWKIGDKLLFRISLESGFGMTEKVLGYMRASKPIALYFSDFNLTSFTLQKNPTAKRERESESFISICTLLFCFRGIKVEERCSKAIFWIYLRWGFTLTCDKNKRNCQLMLLRALVLITSWKRFSRENKSAAGWSRKTKFLVCNVAEFPPLFIYLPQILCWKCLILNILSLAERSTCYASLSVNYKSYVKTSRKPPYVPQHARAHSDRFLHLKRITC